jgi:DNA-binding winged helix-turn-helix (wHTH) protein
MKELNINQQSVSLNRDYAFNYRKGSIIKKNGNEIFLEHRLKDFISILIEHKNDVVTRNELMTHVWKDVIVNDESITKAASDFRKFLTKNNINDLKLITIRKLGYKLEINEPAGLLIEKNRLLFLALKSLGYVFLTFTILIVLIRAIRY